MKERKHGVLPRGTPAKLKLRPAETDSSSGSIVETVVKLINWLVTSKYD
jgi:hypothetical protein